MQITCAKCGERFLPGADGRCPKCHTYQFPAAINTSDRKPHRTIAEQCRDSDDAFLAATQQAGFRTRMSDYRIVFHFHDRSYLSFAVSYTATDAGVEVMQ